MLERSRFRQPIFKLSHYLKLSQKPVILSDAERRTSNIRGAARSPPFFLLQFTTDGAYDEA